MSTISAESPSVINVLSSVNDPLFISNSDHPGASLTNTPFNGGNFHAWSRTVKMALGAKLKLGFIDGSCRRPADDHDDLQRWIRCDYMVTCWILNSMNHELSDAFLYAKSAKALWTEITDRYGQSNRPLIYQLERDISRISQGNLPVATYFNKLKKCWDELQHLSSIPSCICGKMNECSCQLDEKLLELDNRSKLIQFLMKLNDNFESVRNHILSMDPLPNVSKAYYLVQQVEKQKEVTTSIPDSSAFFANLTGSKNNVSSKRFSPKPDIRSENKRSCTFCKQDGHLFE